MTERPSDPPGASGQQHTVPLAQAVATGMTCLGDLRDATSDLFTPEQSREAIDDLIHLLPDMPESLRRQYGLQWDPTVIGTLQELRAALDGWTAGAALPEAARELARTAMAKLLGASF